MVLITSPALPGTNRFSALRENAWGQEEEKTIRIYSEELGYTNPQGSKKFTSVKSALYWLPIRLYIISLLTDTSLGNKQ